MNYYFEALKKYAQFNGRARRKEYWIFYLANIAIEMIIITIEHLTGLLIKTIDVGPIYILFGLIIFIPSYSVLVRRLHDTGRSGWWIFISLVPIAGPFILLGILLSDGKLGENKYGSNPKKLLKTASI